MYTGTLANRANWKSSKEMEKFICKSSFYFCLLNIFHNDFFLCGYLNERMNWEKKALAYLFICVNECVVC